MKDVLTGVLSLHYWLIRVMLRCKYASALPLYKPGLPGHLQRHDMPAYQVGP